jgi:putative MFS transporter
LPALAITAYLLTAWSTRWTLVAYAVGGAVALVALGASVTAGLLTPLLLIILGSAVFFFITSIGGAFSVYAAEVFPTAIRVRRSGIVAGVGKFGAVVGPSLGGLWLASGGSTLGLQLPFAAALVLAASVLALAGVETRSLTLEEIDTHQAEDL